MSKSLWMYRTTAFISGMSVMAIELAASRFLSPYFSSSMPVWTVIIGIIMISMSLGNILGGQLADKSKDDSPIFRRIFLAGAWVVIMPLVGKYIIALMALIAGIAAGNQVIVVGSALSCLALFAFPMVCFGMVAPFLVRMAVHQNPQTPGKATGSIYAAGTIGSILGTFLPSFVTVPMIGVSKTFYLFGFILLLMVLVRSIFAFKATAEKRRFPVFPILCVVLSCALLVVPSKANYAFWESNLVYEGESVYNYLQVREDSQAQYFSTNVLFGVQSEVRKDDQLTGMCYDGMLIGSAFDPNFSPQKPISSMLLGLGTGTYPRLLQHFFPGSTCKAVEIDPDIVKLSHKYFGMDKDVAEVTVGDGRMFVKNAKEKFDVIVADAYQDIALPFHMATQEFYTLCRDKLKENGTLVININMNTKKNTSIVDAISTTVLGVFPRVYAYNVPNASNTLLFAPMTGNLVTLNHSIQKISQMSPLTSLMTDVAYGLRQKQPKGKVLTDDCAPVEILAASVISQLITDERAYYEERAKAYGGGLSGLYKAITQG